MRISSAILFFAFIITGCSTPPVAEEPYRSDSIADTVKKADSVIVETKCEFNMSAFKMVADSLIGVIDRNNDTFRVQTYTGLPDSLGKSNYFFPLTLSTDHFCRYQFTPPKKSSIYRFWVVTAAFSDSVSASAAFGELRKRSRDEEPMEELIPGLTYENDYVLFAGKTIYWLNTGCPYGAPTNSVLKKAFLHSICEKTVNDSIICYCGGYTVGH